MPIWIRYPGTALSSVGREGCSNIRSGKQQTCQINEQTLNQRDLAEIKFLFLRGPLIAYLDCHALVLERWP